MPKKQTKDIFEDYKPFKALKLTANEKEQFKDVAMQIYVNEAACAALPADQCTSTSFLHMCLVRDEDTGKIVIKTKSCPKRKLQENYLVRQFANNKLGLSLLNNKQDYPIIDVREEKLNQILADSIKNNKIIGFCLQGTVGVGKTYKIISYCNDMILKNNRKIAYLFLPEAVRQMKDNFSLDNLLNKRIIDNCCLADILVLDDFGAEYTNAWFYLNVLLVILNYRCEQEKPIIVISNLKMNKLIQVLKKNLTTKDGKLDSETKDIMIARLIDRLAMLVDNTEYSYEGPSKRLKKKA
ncbi:MAG: ATP-binding protein [Mycoplasma sp.]|nr:ATP-binding protein [Candidatus Hennigella equi]